MSTKAISDQPAVQPPNNDVPIRVTEDAAEFLRPRIPVEVLAQIFEHTRRTVPGLKSIDVVLDPATESIPEGAVIIANRERAAGEQAPTDRQWGDWFVDTFPPEIIQHMVLISRIESNVA